MRVLSERVAVHIDITGSLPPRTVYQRHCEPLRANPGRIFSGLSLIVNISHDTRPRFEEWISIENNREKFIYYPQSQTMDRAGNDTWYGTNVYTTSGTESWSGFDYIRPGWGWSTYSEFRTLLESGRDLARVVTSAPVAFPAGFTVNTLFILFQVCALVCVCVRARARSRAARCQQFCERVCSPHPLPSHAWLQSPIFINPELASKWAGNISSDEDRAQVLIAYCKNDTLCPSDVDQANIKTHPNVALYSQVRLAKAPLYGIVGYDDREQVGTAAPACVHDPAVTDKSTCRSYTEELKHLLEEHVMERKDMLYVGTISGSIYVDRVAWAALRRYRTDTYLIGCEDVTGVPGFELLLHANGQDEAVPAIGSYSWERMIYRNNGTLPYTSGVRRTWPVIEVPTGAGMVKVQQTAYSMSVWRYWGVPFSTGLFMFATDPRDGIPYRCENATYYTGSLATFCTPQLSPMSFHHMTSNPTFGQSYLISIGGRIWHLYIATPDDFVIDRETSTFSLIGGLITAFMLTCVTFGVMAIRNEKAKREAFNAAAKAHELTVSYACHELRYVRTWLAVGRRGPSTSRCISRTRARVRVRVCMRALRAHQLMHPLFPPFLECSNPLHALSAATALLGEELHSLEEAEQKLTGLAFQCQAQSADLALVSGLRRRRGSSASKGAMTFPGGSPSPSHAPDIVSSIAAAAAVSTDVTDDLSSQPSPGTTPVNPLTAPLSTMRGTSTDAAMARATENGGGKAKAAPGAVAAETTSPGTAATAALSASPQQPSSFAPGLEPPLAEQDVMPSTVVADAARACQELMSQLRDDTSTIAQACEQLHQVVNDFTDLQRLHTGRFELRVQPARLRPLLKRTVDLLSPLAPAHIYLWVHRDVPSQMLIDQLRVQQIVSNGLTNACKYSKPDTDIYVCVWPATATSRVATV
ncbi:MAG: HAMP domain-containing histidine kinase, partial [Methanosarcinales archaeon]